MGITRYPPATGGGSGDVTGPGSSTDNTVARFDGTTGKTVQGSGVAVDDSHNVSTPGTVAAAGLAGSLLPSGSPAMNGTAAAGSSAIPARSDHVHPGDEMRLHRSVYRLKAPSGWYHSTKSAVGITTFAAAASRAYYVPIHLDAGTVDRIGAEVTTAAAGSTIRLGIYAHDDSTGRPASRILDAGTIDGNTVGVQEITISQAIATAGVYWLVAVAQGGSPTWRTHGARAQQWMTNTAAAAAGTSLASALVTTAYQDSVTGALPASATVASWTGGTQGPIILVRYA